MSIKKLFNAIKLQIEDNKTIVKVKDGTKTIIKCNNKPFVIGIPSNGLQPYKNQNIVFNTQSKNIDCSYFLLENSIHEILSAKIGFIVSTLLEFIQNPELYNGVKSQKVKQLVAKLITDNLIDFNDIGSNNLLTKWKNIINNIAKKPFQDGLISLKPKTVKVCLKDIEEITFYKKYHREPEDEKCTFGFFDSFISVDFPFYNMLKQPEKQFVGQTLDKNEIEILKAIYQFIFKDIDKKDAYSSLDKPLLHEVKETKDVKKILFVDKIGKKNTPTMLLIETFNLLAKHVDEILDEISDINESLIENEKFNLNLTEEEINNCKSLNEFVPRNYFGSIQDLRNEIKSNPRIQFEEFNKQQNEASNKLNKQVSDNRPKVKSRQRYSSLGRTTVSLSSFASNILAPVNILDPDDISFKEMIPDEQRKRHTYILAGSGSGKTSLLETFLYTDCQNPEQSTIIFDLMGKATKSILKFVDDPTRLLIIDPYLHASITPVINPFEFLNADGTTNENPSEIEIENRTNAIINAFDIALKLKDGWSVNMKAVLAPCISTLLRRGNADIFELQRFMNDELNKDLVNLGRKSPVKGHKSFFEQEFYNESFDVTKRAISAKLQVFLNDPTFTNLVTGKSTINLIKEINTRGKVIIFKLPSKQKLFARLMMEMIQDAMRERINISEDKIVPTHIYLDEFQHYTTPTIEEILSESRNYKFYVTFAHQSFVQLSKKMQGIVLSNSNIKIVGQCSYDNGKKMAKEIKADFEIIESLDQGEFVFKVGSKDVFKSKNTDKFINDKTPYHNKQRTRHMKHQFKNYYVYKELTTSQGDVEISDSTTLTPKYNEF